MKTNNSFLGRGWSFPPVFNPITAGVEMVEQEAVIAASLETLLSTLCLERLMIPEYGCYLDELSFEIIDSGMKKILADKIESAIIYHEPRIKLEEVLIDDSNAVDGLVLISLNYQIKITNSRFNFVFPFYKLEGTDVNLTIKMHAL